MIYQNLWNLLVVLADKPHPQFQGVTWGKSAATPVFNRIYSGVKCFCILMALAQTQTSRKWQKCSSKIKKKKIFIQWLFKWILPTYHGVPQEKYMNNVKENIFVNAGTYRVNATTSLYCDKRHLLVQFYQSLWRMCFVHFFIHSYARN